MAAHAPAHTCSPNKPASCSACAARKPPWLSALLSFICSTTWYVHRPSCGGAAPWLADGRTGICLESLGTAWPSGPAASKSGGEA
eukprot:261117-Pelagomonas_calceolata.AAC.6